jgi:5'-nucleotidase
MAYPIDQKLVIAVASSALFDLSESDRIFHEEGEEKYRKFQETHVNTLLAKGVAFPFIRRILRLNHAFPEYMPVEVVLLSRNSPETGMRVMRSIEHYGLDITRAAFFSGNSPYAYIPAYNTSLFLSANIQDVQQAIHAGYPAGRVIDTPVSDNEQDTELRIAFDFDGVIIDDEAEVIFQASRDIDQFNKTESEKSTVIHNPGPLLDLFRKISFFQQIEREKVKNDPAYQRIVKISIITARGAPSHERMIHTLKNWGVVPDETFLLGGIEKRRILHIMKPHIYFDDQQSHLSAVDNIPLVHIPFGVLNNTNKG